MSGTDVAGTRTEGNPMRRVRRLHTLAAAVLALAALPGCEGSGPEQGFVVRDSAGVAIAENHLGPENDQVVWRLSEEPHLEIGVRDGPVEYQFSDIFAVHRGADGRIVVGERSDPAGMIRFYDPEGRFLHRVGRQGDGPGEFRLPSGLWPYRGDSIAVWDGMARRLSVLGPEGEVGRTTPLAIPSDNPPAPEGMRSMEMGSIRAPFPDGSFFVAPGRLMRVGSEPIHYEHRYLRLSPDGEVLDTVGPFPQPEPREGVTLPTGRRLAPFPGSRARLVHGDRVVAGVGDRGYELGIYRMDGSLERLVRVRGRERPVTGEMREAYRTWEREQATTEEGRRAIEAALGEVRFPEALPTYLAVLVRVDAEGHLWVPEYRLAWDEGPIRWDILDPEGRHLGMVETPEQLRILWIGEDGVLGIWRDELAVPYLRLYGLER
jgi:hypothetical protein